MRKKIIYIGDLSVIEKGDPYLGIKLEIRDKCANDDPKERIYNRLIIKEAMKVLTKQQKECIKLRLKGYSQKEIAEKMDISQPAVALYLRNAYKKMKQFSQKY